MNNKKSDVKEENYIISSEILDWDFDPYFRWDLNMPDKMSVKGDMNEIWCSVSSMYEKEILMMISSEV